MSNVSEKQGSGAARSRGLMLLLISLYGPAIGGIGWKIWTAQSMAEQILAAAIFLLSLDLGWMAGVDLRQEAAVRSQLQASNQSSTVADTVADSDRLKQLIWFRRVTITTIALELLGLYGCWGSLFGGAIVILLSQVGFNVLAGIQLHPDRPEQPEKIVPFGIRDRAIVLLADVLGLGLVSLGLIGVAPLSMAIGLLSMVLIYGLVKGFENRKTVRN